MILLTCAGAMGAGIFLALLNLSMEQILLPAAFAYGLFAFPLYSLCVAHTNDFADSSKYVEVACGLLLIYAIGAVIGPIVASIFMWLIGPGGLFAFTVIVHFATIIFVVYRLRRREVMPVAEPISFADAMRVGLTVSSVDSISHPEDEQKQQE